MERKDELRAQLCAESDRCVLCGMCARVCPTYGLYREEGESPRGRVMLVRALLSGEVEATETLRRHLDHCLGCRACEALCPSGVRYGELLDGARALLRPPPPTPVDRLAASIRWWRPLAPVLAAAQRLRLLPALPGGARVPPLPARGPMKKAYAPRGAGRGRVGLFLGCVASLWDRDTLEAAVSLLTASGYAVVVPRAQGCCGALAWHDGRRREGRRQAAELVRAFAGVERVAFAATGCSAHALEYGAVLGAAGADFAGRVAEVGALVDLERLGPWKETPRRVALHVPCSQRHGWRDDGLYRRLLAGLPGVEVVPLEAGFGCCGAAGSRVLHEPDQARALRAPLMEAVADLGVDEVLTANVGCRLHLGDGLGESSVDIPVRHPLAFLADRLQGAGE